MRSFLLFMLLATMFIACHSTKKQLSDPEEQVSIHSNDTVRIANDDIEYEIIVIEPGFNTWVNSIARQRGYYSQSFLENRNRILVMEWNNRVIQPNRYDHNLYQMRINYNYQTDYGYEVNYLLYNYFIYFQLKYNQRLSNFVPRI